MKPCGHPKRGEQRTKPTMIQSRPVIARESWRSPRHALSNRCVRAGTMAAMAVPPPSAAQERAGSAAAARARGRGGRVRARDGRRRRPRGPDEREVVERFARAWERGDYGAMYAELTDAAPRARPARRASRAATGRRPTTATVVSVRAAAAGAPARRRRRRARHGAHARVRHDPRTCCGCRSAPRTTAPRIAWAPATHVPGPARRRAPAARHEPPPRAPTCSPATARRWPRARRGPPRSASPARSPAQLGPDPARARRASCAAPACPPDAQVGIDRARARLRRRGSAGTPGGMLLAGGRGSARARPAARPDVRTSIDARDPARGGRRARRPLRRRSRCMRPRDGEVLALAGVAFSGAPAAGLDVQDRHAGRRAGGEGRQAPTRRYPGADARRSTASSWRTPTARRAAARCATPSRDSCNSVFAPLGAKLGRRAARRDGRALRLQPAPPASPAPRRARSRPRRRSATTWRSARRRSARAACRPPRSRWRVAATIGDAAARPRRRCARRGRQRCDARHARAPRARSPADDRGRRATAPARRGDPRRARRGQDRHRRAQEHAAARVPDDAAGADGDRRRGAAGRLPPGDDPSDTDAWFSAFAPAGLPRVAWCVLVVGAGAGGDTAAPIAKSVLEAGLKSRR